MASVRLIGITKSFRGKGGVTELNLDIKDKEFFCLMGPPGVGKTTTLRLIAGLERVEKGEVHIGDRMVNDIPPRERNVSMVFQNLALYPNKTAFENMATPLRKRKTAEPEIGRRVREIASILQIEHLLNRKPATFSGGELQRVALGRAIVVRPDVYLLDEPLANLDALIRANMRAELKKMQKEVGQTFVYATMDQVEAMSMSDRIAVMNDGQVQQCDTPENIYSKSANKFVAGAIGSPAMNFLECICREEQSGAILLDFGTFKIDVTKLGKLLKDNIGSEVIFGVRPEDVEIAPNRLSKDFVESTVEITEPLGPKTVAYMKVGDNAITATVSKDFKAEMGDKKYVHFNIDKTHIFDKKSEQAIV